MKKSLVLFVMPLALLCIAVVSWQCIEAPLSPVAPASKVTLGSIPIVDITKYFSEYEQKSKTNFLVVDSIFGMYDYLNKQTSPKQTFTLPPASATDTSIRVAIGSFSIGSLSASQLLDASEISSTLISNPFGFPASNFEATGPAFDKSSQFDFVLLADTATNTLTMSVTNAMDIPFVFTDSMVLRNNSASPFDTNKVAAFFGRNDTIASGATITKSTSIRGKMLRGAMKMDSIKIYTPGKLTAFTVNTNSKLTFTLTSSLLTADSASAVIPMQTVSSPGTTTWQVDDSTVLNEAKFKSGQVNLAVQNNTGVDIGMWLTINELLGNTNGAPYSINPTIPSGTNSTSPLDMSQYYIQGGATAGSSGNKFGTQITYSAVIRTLDSKNAKKIISKNDYVTASIKAQAPFALQYVNGRIRTTTVNVDRRFASNINVNDLKGFSGNIALDSLLLYMHLPMGGGDGSPADYDLLITEKNTKHNVVNTLHLTSAVYGRYDPNSHPNLTVRSNADTAFFNSLTRFFPDVPDSFYVQGTVVLDPDFIHDSRSYTFTDTTGLYPTFDIHIPLRFSMANTSYTQTIAFDSSQIPTDFTKNVGNGTVSFTTLNNLPLQMNMKASFLKYNKVTGKNDVLFTLPDTTINRTDIMHIQAAQVDPNGWSNSHVAQTTSTISLSSSDMEKFNQTDSIKIQLYNLQSTNGQTVRVLGSNYIRIIGIGNITYTIKPN